MVATDIIAKSCLPRYSWLYNFKVYVKIKLLAMYTTTKVQCHLRIVTVFPLNVMPCTILHAW